MAEYSSRVEEIADVEAYLLRLEAMVRTKALKKAIGAACKVVRNRARELCPVDEGDLRKSISYVVRAYQDDTVIVGIVGPANVRGKKNPGRYGRLVEYGHLMRNFSGGSESVGARPFLRPAADQTGLDQEAAMMSSLTASIKEAES